MILLADREDPDQTVWVRRLILAFDVRIYPKTRFRMARLIYPRLFYFARASCKVCDVNIRNELFTAKLVQQGYRYH